jgi:hypothetical protein
MGKLWSLEHDACSRTKPFDRGWSATKPMCRWLLGPKGEKSIDCDSKQPDEFSHSHSIYFGGGKARILARHREITPLHSAWLAAELSWCHGGGWLDLARLPETLNCPSALSHHRCRLSRLCRLSRWARRRVTMAMLAIAFRKQRFQPCVLSFSVLSASSL